MSEEIERRTTLFLRNPTISYAATMKWWGDLPPRHRGMFLVSLVIFFTGMIDLILYLAGIHTWFFWTNDLLLMFGGFILTQVAIVYAIKGDDK